MNKLVLSFVLVAVVAVALGTAGLVYAQTSTPPAPALGSGYGPGMMNGRGNRGGMMASTGFGVQDGILHDAMIAVFSQKLGISADELNARLAKGETVAQIAYSKGFTTDQFTAMMTEARTQAIDQAVKDGTLTQAQADWMKQRGAGMNGGARGFGQGRGMRGNGTCPYLSTTTP